MPQQGIKCEKCSFFSGSSKNAKRLQCTHLQNPKRRKISERQSNTLNVHNRNSTIINAKLPADHNSNSFNDDNYSLSTLNSPLPIDDNRDSSATISHLPNEMLYEIFSHLPFKDFFYGVSGVCRRWNAIATDCHQWKTISVDSKIPSNRLLQLLSQVPMLHRLEVKNRHDTNAILRKVIKFCPRIRTITLANCHGSKSVCKVNYGSLIKAVTTHTSLEILLTEGTRLSRPPPLDSKVMQLYTVVKYVTAQGNLIVIVPTLRR